MQPPPIYHLALALALVIGWSSFDAPLLQWPFGGASRREPPVHCLVHVERPFVASKLRTWVTWHPNELANFHVLFLFSSIPPPESQKTRYRCGICSRFLGHDVSYLFFFPKVESTIAFAWRCHLVCLVDNCLLIILNYFKKLEAPNDAHTLASERSCQNSTFVSLLIDPSIGVPKDAVLMCHLFKVCGPWCFLSLLLPNVESTIAFAWRCHLVFMVDNRVLLLNYRRLLAA